MKRHQRRSLLLCLALIVFCISSLSAAPTIPQPTSLKYINDYAGIMNDAPLKQVVSIGKELEDQTGAQAVVVILPTLEGMPIEDYSLNLFRTWGIGQAGKDNGLLLLVALQDRQWRVEVGRGLEGAIPDALSNRVMETIAKPLFSEGNYPLGIINAYSSLCDLIANEYGITLTKSLNIPLPTQSNSSSGISLPIIVVILLLMDILLNRGRVFSSLLQLLMWNNIWRGGGPRGGGGYGNNNGNGGGFGGFGGGSSNGGGSSGSW